MSDSLPEWFAADQVHEAGDGWYVGAADGYRVGPFPSRTQAEASSRDLTARLGRCRNTTEQVRQVRRFIIDQRREHGRKVRAAETPDATAPGGRAPDSEPPVRAGERARVWFRTHRVFAVGENWFFATREDIEVGPYPSRDMARAASERLLAILQVARDAAAALRAIEEFAARDPAAGA